MKPATQPQLTVAAQKSWIGRKKLAFVPLFRPNAHPPDVIPADWEDQILRRVLYDPDPNTGADRSLRAYIHKVSSGRADLDAAVLPRTSIDRQDVPPNILEEQLGAQLRQQGFDCAAIVMLGGRGAGTSAGFWVRFVMVEEVGVWAMEFMHSLTGFGDLYVFGGNMGRFDEMAASAGTHPSTYTKAAIGWLDASAIAHLSGRAADYALYNVGLVQPPPLGRYAAVRVGSDVPYFMVEARQRIDPFDAGIPSEGVIVYRVQTRDPLGWAQNGIAPVELLTPQALTVGQAYTADTGLTVRVLSGIAGGFVVRVEDANNHIVDRSAEFNKPAAGGPPTVCVIPGLGVHNIAYRDTSGHLHELWRNGQGATGTTDLTANAGASAAAGDPFAYLDPSNNSEVVVYRGTDGNVHSLYWSTGPVGHDNLTGSVGAPKTKGNPIGWFTPGDGYHHVAYRTSDGHLHELYWTGPNPVGHGDLTALASAPAATGDPSGYVDLLRGVNIVVYRSTDGHIRSLYWSNGPIGVDDLSGVAGTPVAAGDPVAYYTPHDDAHQVVYRAADGHIWELYWNGVAPVAGWDLTAQADAAPATGNLAVYYSAGTNTKHVLYRSADGRVHEIWWTPGGGIPAHVDITARYGAPLAADRPAAFIVDGPNTQHVAYRGTDNHIYEVIW
ncbi:MAG TPA: hypothetical protein VES20_25465 [Bryobacteraceae bacterium]|nr:hypothetical protein [Bryobacteraceae bacterium]